MINTTPGDMPKERMLLDFLDTSESRGQKDEENPVKYGKELTPGNEEQERVHSKAQRGA